MIMFKHVAKSDTESFKQINIFVEVTDSHVGVSFRLMPLLVLVIFLIRFLRSFYRFLTNHNELLIFIIVLVKILQYKCI